VLSAYGRPGGVHPIFNGTLRDNLEIQDFTDRSTTSFPITNHGGPVMATPSKLQHTLNP